MGLVHVPGFWAKPPENLARSADSAVTPTAEIRIVTMSEFQKMATIGHFLELRAEGPRINRFAVYSADIIIPRRTDRGKGLCRGRRAFVSGRRAFDGTVNANIGRGKVNWPKAKRGRPGPCPQPAGERLSSVNLSTEAEPWGPDIVCLQNPHM